MTKFERNLNILISSLIGCESNLHYSYKVYRLAGEDQARIFRLPRRVIKAANDEPPPSKGLFVAAAMHPELNQLVLSFRAFPKEGGQTGESQSYAALAYDQREVKKGQKHVLDWITCGVIPVADEEFAQTA